MNYWRTEARALAHISAPAFYAVEQKRVHVSWPTEKKTGQADAVRFINKVVAKPDQKFTVKLKKLEKNSWW